MPSSDKSNEENLKESSLEAKVDDTLQVGFVAGLLSSSCCLLQLFLNTLSWFNLIHVGCAGFNKLLGPPRPYLRAVTWGWLGLCWYEATSRSNQQPRGRLFRTTLVTLLVMYLPEMLQFYNHAHPIVRNSLTLVPKPSAEWKELALIVNYMGCEACESAVRNILESRREVEMAQVDWESGHVKIYGPRVQELDLAAVTRLLEEHGYALATSQVDILSPVTIQSE